MNIPDTTPDAPTPSDDARVSQQEMPVQSGATAACNDDQHIDETEADFSSPVVGASAASAQGNATVEDAVRGNDASRTSADFTPIAP